MENVFEEVLGGSTPETESTDTSNSTTNEVPELGSEYDLDLNDVIEGESEESSENTQTDDNTSDDNSYDFGYENPTNQAFAQMRTQNKEYSNKLNELDALAKAAGLKDVDDLIAKSKEAQIRNMAKKEGISESMARQFEEFKEFKAQYEQDQINRAMQEKERALVGNLQEFISANKLSKEAVDKMSGDLERDGFTIERLMDLPKSALNRIFSSYVGASVQKNLERKEAIKNELPLSQTSNKIDNQTLNKEIDKLARLFAGK